jgi:signal transduction histidine kinase
LNLYSNKQKWKVILIAIALGLVGISLFVSNSIVQKVHEREKQRATQWADAIQKKVELVELTDSTFSRLRDREREKMQLWIEATKEVSKPTALDQNADFTFPFLIINKNTDIPVVLVDDQNTVSGHINIDFSEQDIQQQFPSLSQQEVTQVFEDSLLRLTKDWQKTNKPFTIEIIEGFFMTYYYTDSRQIRQLEKERDSLISSFSTELINNDGLVPVILVDDTRKKILGTNLPDERVQGDLSSILAQFEQQNEPIVMRFGNNRQLTLYYERSPELMQLQYFPIIQFLIIGLFVLIGYLIFSTFRKAEQNQVWAGMAKETAHQLGTPLSSLLAWTELLDQYEENKAYTPEMRKDIQRLEKVSDRFSKIGSEAKLDQTDIVYTIEQIINYLSPRLSKQVQINFDPEFHPAVPHNAPLMEWVIENLIKNAVDAMEAKGQITIEISKQHKLAHIDITDTGKGIPSNQVKSVFQPGFSTKKRGWGLGLSLVKRIVKEYHKGDVFVLHSELNKGTTFRINLPL